MISIFKKNDVANIFLLLPYTLLLRFKSLMSPHVYEPTSLDTVPVEWVFSLIDSPFIQAICAILLVYAQAIIINIIANNNRLHRLPSALAGMIYILLASSIPEFQILTPALIGMTFILLAIMNIFHTYNMTSAAESIFNAALASSAAAIIYVPYVFAIIALFIGLAMLRNFSLTERFQFILGYGALLWIVGAFLFFFDVLQWDFLQHVRLSGLFDQFSFSSKETLWKLGVSLLLVFISLFNYYNFMKKKGIDIRKKIDFFYWLMLCSLLSLLIFRGLEYQHYYFVLASLSLFISMSILLIRKILLAEMIHFLALVAVFYIQFS